MEVGLPRRNLLPLEGGGPLAVVVGLPQCDLLPPEGGGPLAVEVGLPRDGRHSDRQTIRLPRTYCLTTVFPVTVSPLTSPLQQRHQLMQTRPLRQQKHAIRQSVEGHAKPAIHEPAR